MKLLFLILFATFCGQLPALDLSALQSADNWPAIETALKAQRAEIVAAHEAALLQVAAQIKTAAAALEVEKRKTAEAEADLAALKARISSVLNGLLTEELKTGEGPRTAILRKLIAESEKSDKQLKLEALEAEIAAKQKELQTLKP